MEALIGKTKFLFYFFYFLYNEAENKSKTNKNFTLIGLRLLAILDIFLYLFMAPSLVTIIVFLDHKDVIKWLYTYLGLNFEAKLRKYWNGAEMITIEWELRPTNKMNQTKNHLKKNSSHCLTSVYHTCKPCTWCFHILFY